MGYEAVTEWSMLSADRRCPYRPILEKIRWAAGPDHSDWSPLIPELRDIRFLAKRLATDFISKMNEMRSRFLFRRAEDPSGSVEEGGEPESYEQIIDRREHLLEPALEEDLEPSRSLQHAHVSGAFDVSHEGFQGHVAGGSDAEQREAPPEEHLLGMAGHVSLQVVIPLHLRPPSAVPVAVAHRSRRRYHVFVERFRVVAHFSGVKEGFVGEFDVFADSLLEIDPMFPGHVRAVQHRPRSHGIFFRRSEDGRFLPGHAVHGVFAAVLLEGGALGRVYEIASDHVRAVFLGDGGHFLEIMQRRLVVHVQEPQVFPFREVLPVILGASQSSGVRVFHGDGVLHLRGRFPGFRQ